MEIVRSSLHRNWRPERLIAELAARVSDDGLKERTHRDRLAAFLATGKPAAILVESRLELGRLGLELMRTGALDSLRTGHRSDEKLRLGSIYSLRSQQFLLARQDEDFLRTSRTHGFVDDATNILAAALSLGWNAVGVRFGEWLLWGAVKGYFTDTRAIFRNCFPWFCLRLFADWQDIQVEQWPEHPFPAPEYDAVLAHWHDPDPSKLGEILLAVCDRHTHECFKWSDKPDKHGDFVNDVYWGWPIEVHMVFRIREDRGLPIPRVDHPLMQTALGAYLPPVPIPSDELLDRITAMAIQTYPTLAERL